MLNSTRTDLAIEKEIKNAKFLYKSNDIRVFNLQNIYHLISYNDLLDSENLKKCLEKEINYFIKKILNKEKYHVFIVGLGNENNTADSIGPKVVKNIKVNSHLDVLGIDNSIKVSALEPGVLGQTGIETKKIIESVSNIISPDIIVIIDSYVTRNFKYLNKSIQITDEGIIPGSGLNSKSEEISYKTLNIPVLVIGVPTAIEVNFKNSKISYLVATKDVDYYVYNISLIISDVLNKFFSNY